VKSKRILVVANYPPPLRGTPTLGPGLRAFSLARGLARAGHKISLSFPDTTKISENIVTDFSREQGLDTAPVAMTKLGEFIQKGTFEFVIMTNFHGFTHIIDDVEQGRFPSTRFIYDFFAPRLLEEASAPQADAGQIAEWMSLKHRALRVSAAILVNGSKKLSYVTGCLLAAKANLSKPLIPAGFAIETGTEPSPSRTKERDFAVHPPRALVAGNQQPWTDSQMPTMRLLQALADHRWELVACGKPEFSTLFANSHIARRFANLKIESYESLPFDAFCDRQASSDLIIDAFTRSPERELAYVTRTAVALSAGLPAIHPAWTETGEIIRSYGAGWLYESDREIPKIIEWISHNPQDLSSKRNAAAKLRRQQLNEACSVASLCSYLEAVDSQSRGPEIRERVNRTASPQAAFFLHSVFDPDWYAVRYGLPFIDEGEAAPDYYERHATAERSAPNFLIAYLQKRHGLGDLRSIAPAELLSALEGWLDTAWLRSKFSLGSNASAQEVVTQYFKRLRTPGCDPNRFFSEAFYSRYYPDAAACVRLGAFINGYDHYLAVGQAKGYFPSPFVVPEDSDLTGQGSRAADLFASVVTNVANVTDSPTPFFDLTFWRQSFPNREDSRSLGPEFLSFIDNFSQPGAFGSAFHREILMTDGQRRHEAKEQATRHAWALGLLTAYGQRAGA
jgi:hypothetical protein